MRRGTGASARAFLLALAMLPGLGCALHTSQAGSLRIGGSDTMAILTQRWAEEFMRLNPGVVVEAVGGGSGWGIEALLRREVDVSAASRAMLPEEVEQLYARHGTLGVSFRCAKDAVSVYLNPQNPLRGLSLTQLEAIFTGQVRSWSDLGGAPVPIVVLLRQPGSGTYHLFRELVLSNQPFTTDSRTLPTTAAVVDAVRHEPGAVGFGGLAYGPDLIHARIEGVEAVAEQVRSGEYPLARYLYLNTLRPPSGLAKRFVDWTLGPAGQRVVAEVGFVPLWEPRGTR